MKILIGPGDIITIGYLDKHGDEMDGDLKITHDDKSIRVETDWGDTSGRVGVVYEEVLSAPVYDEETDLSILSDLSTRRAAVAEQIGEDFDFDPDGDDDIDDITMTSSWSVEEDNVWSTSVFVTRQGEITSTKYKLTVCFAPGEDKVTEARASAENGHTITQSFRDEKT